MVHEDRESCGSHFLRAPACETVLAIPLDRASYLRRERIVVFGFDDLGLRTKIVRGGAGLMPK
jgi:hypothetical protein